MNTQRRPGAGFSDYLQGRRGGWPVSPSGRTGPPCSWTEVCGRRRRLPGTSPHLLSRVAERNALKSLDTWTADGSTAAATIAEENKNDKLTHLQQTVSPFLQNLWIGDAGVGHVRVDAAPAVPAGPRPRTPSDRLVIADSLAAEGNVVHAALIRGRQRSVKDV